MQQCGSSGVVCMWCELDCLCGSTFDLLKSEYKTYRETKIPSEIFDADPDKYDETYIIGS